MKFTTDQINAYIDELSKNEDNMKRLLRLTMITDNTKFQNILDGLLDNFISINDLDYVNINDKDNLDEFIKNLIFDKSIIDNPSNDQVKELIEKVNFENFIYTIKSEFKLLLEPINMENQILNIKIGKPDVVNYKTDLQFKGDFDNFYNTLTNTIPVTNEYRRIDSYTAERQLRKSDVNYIQISNPLDQAVLDIFKDTFLMLYKRFDTDSSLFVDNYMNVNDSKANLYLYSNRSSFISSYSVNNKFFIYYINVIIEGNSKQGH